jgi:trk system potassium uptake protein TrkA
MRIFIAGGHLTAAQLASRLLAEGHDVCLVEHQPAILDRIHRELPTEAIFEGDYAYPRVLEQAGIRQAEVLVAFSAQDAVNLALCFVAHTRYHVPRTIAVINDPRNAWLFDQKFHVDVALDTSEILAHLIDEEVSLGDMLTLLKLRRGQVSLVEEVIAEGAKATGVAIRDLPLPDHCVIAGIIRRGELILPRGMTVLEPNDEVLALTNPEGAAQLAALLSPPEEAEVEE